MVRSPTIYGEGIKGRMLGDERRKYIDQHGNKIEIQSCSHCKRLMSMVIGKNYYDWVCEECHFKGERQELEFSNC